MATDLPIQQHYKRVLSQRVEDGIWPPSVDVQAKAFEKIIQQIEEMK